MDRRKLDLISCSSLGWVLCKQVSIANGKAEITVWDLTWQTSIWVITVLLTEQFWSRVIAWITASVAVVAVRSRFRQLETRKWAHKENVVAATADEEKKCNYGQDFLFLLCGGFKEWQQVPLVDSVAFCPAPPLVLSLREAVLCPQLTYTTLTPCMLTRAQVSQSFTTWAARDEPPSIGCVCLHTSKLCWLCYLIPWMGLQGESQSELSLCVIH